MNRRERFVAGMCWAVAVLGFSALAAFCGAHWPYPTFIILAVGFVTLMVYIISK